MSNVNKLDILLAQKLALDYKVSLVAARVVLEKMDAYRITETTDRTQISDIDFRDAINNLPGHLNKNTTVTYADVKAWLTDNQHVEQFLDSGESDDFLDREARE